MLGDAVIPQVLGCGIDTLIITGNSFRSSLRARGGSEEGRKHERIATGSDIRLASGPGTL
jgi:hypothetical protein